ncbi:hypothetical protein BD626DRAFT_15346 [Schizophyllum amplum]|uniref:Pali-domain-containing protein n=1 Tax=Schizophyllum amplum TaxID=97359 RepID=A0A550CXX6_9AGAR|nr:hypothetical protein BD626DRAFT_15346 [Auriculariopsis ampla]
MLGLFLCFAAFVLLIFVTVSAPTWDSVSFLDVPSETGTTHFGVFGFSGSVAHVGFRFLVPINGYDYTAIEAGSVRNLTFTLVLYPIGKPWPRLLRDSLNKCFSATCFSAFVVLLEFCGIRRRKGGKIAMILLAALATLVTVIAWILSMVLFGTVRSRFRDQDIDATWGNANWLGLAALVSLTCGLYAALRENA